MPGGVGVAIQAARFAGGLGAAAAYAGRCLPGAFPSQGRVQRVPVCWGMGFRCAADRLRPVLPCLICRRAWAQLPARTVCRCLRAFLGVLCAVCVRSCWALCRRARILYSSSRRGRVVGAPDRGHRKTKSLSGVVVGRAFVLSGGLIVWGCGCCTASSVGGWVSDLGCVGVCCVCPGCRRAV